MMQLLLEIWIPYCHPYSLFNICDYLIDKPVFFESASSIFVCTNIQIMRESTLYVEFASFTPATFDGLGIETTIFLADLLSIQHAIAYKMLS